ncbi:hypothetical protein IHE44_0007901 [Lamprotornis superbus]|uniref:Uncharacterized protein n=1 Tax=Lamprotornis superbus TaxID=245042 RepID=A0A835NRP7_9PASS|nr:hypothetical protein IHE44_0007901 [Lamprotornis superbus]
MALRDSPALALMPRKANQGEAVQGHCAKVPHSLGNAQHGFKRLQGEKSKRGEGKKSPPNLQSPTMQRERNNSAESASTSFLAGNELSALADEEVSQSLAYANGYGDNILLQLCTAVPNLAVHHWESHLGVGTPGLCGSHKRPSDVKAKHGFVDVSLLSISVSTAVESLHSLNDQISHFIVNKSKTLDEDEDAFLPSEKESLKSAMMLMRHLLMDAQPKVSCSCTTVLDQATGKPKSSIPKQILLLTQLQTSPPAWEFRGHQAEPSRRIITTATHSYLKAEKMNIREEKLRVSTRERAKPDILLLVWMQLWLHLSRECLFLAAEQMVPVPEPQPARAGHGAHTLQGMHSIPPACPGSEAQPSAPSKHHTEILKTQVPLAIPDVEG